MAVLYITEYATPYYFQGNPLTAGMEPGADQTVAIGVGSAQSTTLKNNTTLVRLRTDAICSVAIGLNPTATATNARMAAGQESWFGVGPSSGFKVAVITNT